MDYVSALVPPLVMAVAFTLLVVTIIKNQGGANGSRRTRWSTRPRPYRGGSAGRKSFPGRPTVDRPPGPVPDRATSRKCRIR